MKIAFLTPEYPHEKTGKSGGIGTSIKNLTKGLLLLGCECRVLVYNQKQDAVFIDEGVIVQQIKNVKLKGLSWFLTRKKIEKIINELYNNGDVEIVEAPDWTGITSFIRPVKCPIVIRLNGSDTYFCYLDNRPVKWINKFHEKQALKNADGHISVSQFTADLTNQLLEQNFDYNIIPNGIDTAKFNDNIEFAINKKEVLYFGSLIRKKGLLELPLIFNEIFNKDNEAKFVLIGKDVPDVISGNNSTWEMMQSLFDKDAFKNVTYINEVSYNEIKEYIAKANVCVFPSFAEALPVSWLEAMAIKKAVVTSNIGWANEMIENDINGCMVDPKNHTEFANKVLALLQDNEKAATMGVNARETILKKFDISVVASNSLAYYKRILESK